MAIGQNVSARKMFPLVRSPIGWKQLQLGGTTIPIVHYQFRQPDNDVANMRKLRDDPAGFPDYSSPFSLRSAFEAYYLGHADRVCLPSVVISPKQSRALHNVLKAGTLGKSYVH
jgi:hypothetical protein